MTKQPSKVSFFASAQSQPATKGKKSETKIKVKTPGLATVARITAVIKTLEALKEDAESGVKLAMRDQFVQAGVALGKRPPNYIGCEDTASASLELRKRSERSVLDDFTKELLDGENITTTTTTTYSLNEEVLTPEVMEKVEKALNSVPGIPPNLFTVKTVTTVAEEALDEIFKKDKVKAALLIGHVGTFAIKPKVEESFEETVIEVGKLLGIDKVEA